MVHWTRKSGWCDFGKGNEASKESSASLATTAYAKRTQRLRYPDPEVVILCSRTFQFSEVSCQDFQRSQFLKMYKEQKQHRLSCVKVYLGKPQSFQSLTKVTGNAFSSCLLTSSKQNFCSTHLFQIEAEQLKRLIDKMFLVTN